MPRNDPHPDESALVELARRRNHGPNDDKTARHVESCDPCGVWFRLLRDLGRLQAGKARSLRSGADCPPAELLDGLAQSPDESHDPVRSHLRTCLDCTLEYEGLMRLQGNDLPTLTTGGTQPSVLDRLAALVSSQLPLVVSVVTRGAATVERNAGYERGLVAFAARQFPTAIRQLRQAQADGHSDRDVALYLGASLLATDQTNEAIEVFETALANGRGSTLIRWQLAQGYLRCGEGRQALTQLDRVARGPEPYRSAAREQRRRVREVLTGSH